MKVKNIYLFTSIVLYGACSNGGSGSNSEWEVLAAEGFILQAGEPYTWTSASAELEGASIHFLKPHEAVTQVTVTLERHKTTDEVALLVKGNQDSAPSYFVTLPKQLVEAYGESHIRDHSFAFEPHEPAGAALTDIKHIEPHRITLSQDGDVTIEHDLWGRLQQGDEDHAAGEPTGSFVPPGPMLTASLGVTDNKDSGVGSLRQAIINANENAGTDTISLNLPRNHQFIALMSPLPVITEKVIIDGWAAKGFIDAPLVRIYGLANTGPIFVLGPGSDGSIIRGVSLGTASTAIEIHSSRNVIKGNYIGIAPISGDRTRVEQIQNNTGILIGENATDNIIGSPLGTSSDANSISGNAGAGIIVKGADNVIAGNAIGTDLTTLADFPNNIGIQFDATARNNSVGGEDWLFRNLIRGNTAGDIILGGEGNVVHGDQSGAWLGQ